MQIDKLTFSGFRNLADGEFLPSVGVNILYGDNAQGKTNILEACWLFTGGKSFRGAKDKELVGFEKQNATLCMDFTAEGRQQTATVDIVSRRQITLNAISQKSPSAIVGRFCAVVFCPSHLDLVSGNPDGRRRFLDAAYCQLKPSYIRTLSVYQHLLTQRNTLLKSIRAGQAGGETEVAALLDVWDMQLAGLSANITRARARYIERILPTAAALYGGLSAGKERMSLKLITPITDPAADKESITAQYVELLRKNRCEDIAAGFSTVGAHREDIGIAINGVSAKQYGSQGQQRSAVLALKLSEAKLLKDITGEQPVVMLDDVMSELDIIRQDYILNHMHGRQILITCCDPAAIERQTGGKIFHIQNGKIE